MIKHLLPGCGDAGVVEVFAGMRNSGSEAVAASSSSSATYRSKCFALVSTILPWGFDWVVGGAHLVAPHIFAQFTLLLQSVLHLVGKSILKQLMVWPYFQQCWFSTWEHGRGVVFSNAAAHSKKQVMSHMSLGVCFTCSTMRSMVRLLRAST